jgi:hypothetical protein
MKKVNNLILKNGLKTNVYIVFSQVLVIRFKCRRRICPKSNCRILLTPPQVLPVRAGFFQQVLGARHRWPFGSPAITIVIGKI